MRSEEPVAPGVSTATVHADPRTSVLLLLPGFQVGGLERNALRLVEGMDRTRFRFLVGALDPTGPMADRFRGAGAAVLDLSFSGFGGLGVLRSLRVVKRLVEEHHVSVVHAWNIGPTLLAALALRGASVRLVSSRRSLAYSKGPGALVRRIANRACDIVLPNSKAVEAELLREPGVRPERVRMLYTGLPVPGEVGARRYVARAALDVADGTFLVACVASLRPVKQPGILLAAAAELQRQGLPFCVKVAGDGPLRADLEAECVRLGIRESVDFLGLVDDPSELLSAADVMVLTSSSEGLPTAVMEAMTHGLPVVATDAGGTSEVVQHGETGVLVPVGDAGAVAEVIMRLARDPALCRAMGAAGRARIEVGFSEAAMIAGMEAAYVGK